MLDFNCSEFKDYHQLDEIADFIDNEWRHTPNDTKLFRTLPLEELFHCGELDYTLPDTIFEYANREDPSVKPFLEYLDLNKKPQSTILEELKDHGVHDSILSLYEVSYLQQIESIFLNHYPITNPKGNANQIINQSHKNSNKFGHLLVLIENYSTDTIYNLDFEFEQFRYHPDSMKVPLDEMNFRSLNRGTENLDPGKKALFLLSIYKSDGNHYPEEYISSVWRLKKIDYLVDQKNVSEKIRPPRKDNANKRFLPFGWEGQ